METTQATIILVAKNSLDRDKRTNTEARILAGAGLRVIVLGLRGKQAPLESRDGFQIKRVESSLGLASLFKSRFHQKFRKGRLFPLYSSLASALQYLDSHTRPLAVYLRLSKALLLEKADYYHAHHPFALMVLTSLVARLKSARFILDYNDVLVLEKRNRTGVSYYEQEDIWGGELDARNLARVEATIRELPRGNYSVLDLGCGDGRLTNQLLALYPSVVGVDISSVALRHVEARKLIASGVYIPFADHIFDIVLTTELLEHLPPDAYRMALGELKRVARKWILVGVPWKEQLSIGQARCARCKIQFHANYHWRSFDQRKLDKLLRPQFHMVMCTHVGGDQAYYVGWLLWVNRKVGGIWTRTPATVCPSCGTPLYPGGYPERHAIRNFCDSRNETAKSARQPEKSHVVALYERKSHDA
jgi:SAM-dependent methyltransferase